MAQVLILDASGKLTLPGEVRRRHHLRGGSRLRLAEEAGKLVLEPVERSEAPVRRAARIPLVDAPLRGPIPDHRDLREERLEQLSRLD